MKIKRNVYRHDTAVVLSKMYAWAIWRGGRIAGPVLGDEVWDEVVTKPTDDWW